MAVWRAWSLVERPPLTGAGQIAGERIALLGGAAHPMLPYLATGAGMAIEDRDGTGRGAHRHSPLILADDSLIETARNGATCVVGMAFKTIANVGTHALLHMVMGATLGKA